ncbi:MAG: hypothetical protein PHD74_07725 [Candidatus Krumholzibacteria bacterium]|nr:hypothetical protein [Candidatus Krumholzibacteria bacterium]
MNTMLKAIMVWLLCTSIIAAGGALKADPCLVVYPDLSCVYDYDPAEYYTVGPGDALYNPLYDRGGKVLLLVGSNEIDLSIYQAPNLAGFEASTGGNEGYFFAGTEFNLIIDGFSNRATTYSNILVVFDNVVPSYCMPEIYANGNPITGGLYDAGDLVVSTPTSNGNNYSDTKSISISWHGCYGVHIWAFSDEDQDLKRDGGECFTAYSHDLTIPVQDATWGSIKELFR